MQEGRAAERDSRAVGAANITSSKYWRMPRPRPGERRISAQTAINAPSSLKISRSIGHWQPNGHHHKAIKLALLFKSEELGKIRVHFHIIVCALQIHSAAPGGALNQSATLTLQHLHAEFPRAQVAVYVAPVPNKSELAGSVRRHAERLDAPKVRERWAHHGTGGYALGNSHRSNAEFPPADGWFRSHRRGGGPASGHQFSRKPVSMTERVRAHTMPIWCMVASQYHRCTRWQPIGEAGVLGPSWKSPKSGSEKRSSSSGSVGAEPPAPAGRGGAGAAARQRAARSKFTISKK